MGLRVWIPAVCLLAVLLAGCERTAGTEVGNPNEVVVTAAFSVQQPWDEAYMRNFTLSVLCVRYTTQSNRTGELWATPDGRIVDLLEGGASTLPAQKAEGGWTFAELSLAAPGEGPAWSDTLSFEDFTGSRYIKAGYGKDSLPDFLIELPNDLQYKFTFDSQRLDGWLRNDSLHMTIAFDCGKWLKGVDFSAAARSKDGTGREFVMLSPRDNVELHTELLRKLPEGFDADGYMEVEP